MLENLLFPNEKDKTTASPRYEEVLPDYRYSDIDIIEYISGRFRLASR